MEYYKQNPNRDIPHPEIVDWATSEWLKRTGKVFRDPDRGIRTLHQKGFLIKVGTGVYRYNPDFVEFKKLEDFSPSQKRQIFERDGYKCVLCGKGEREGLTLHADHIKPKAQGGKADVINGETLCSEHNFVKNILGQTELAKKLFIRMYELTKSEEHDKLVKFAAEVLRVYAKHNINGHIEWEE